MKNVFKMFEQITFKRVITTILVVLMFVLSFNFAMAEDTNVKEIVQKACTSDYNPVCCVSANGKYTAGNECMCESQNGKVAYNGECGASSNNTVAPIELITEQVKCVFDGSNEIQKCYLADYNDKYSCSGLETCSMTVSGEKYKKLVWKSSCGGYAYTTIDGESEYAKFVCGVVSSNTTQETIPKPDLVIKELNFKSDGNYASISFYVSNAGNAAVIGYFPMTVYIDGSYYITYIGNDDSNLNYKPKLYSGDKLSFSFNEYGFLVGGEHTITVGVDRDQDGNGIVDELNEGNNKATITINVPVSDYVADLKNYPKLFIKNNKFNGYIVDGDNAPASYVIAAIDIAKSIKDEYGIGVGSSKLASEISDPLNTNLIVIGNSCNNQISNKLMDYPEYCLAPFDHEGDALIKLFENNGHVQIMVSGYTDRDTRQAAEVLAHWKDYDLEGTKWYFSTDVNEVVTSPVNPSTPVQYYPESNATSIKVSPIISRPAPINGADCNGCLVNGACLAFGTRLVESGNVEYCDITKTLSDQKAKGLSCQNNFECGTNQCNDGVCGSIAEDLKETRGMMQQILDWLAKIF